MPLRRTIIGLAIILPCRAVAADCVEPQTGTREAPLLSPPRSAIVIGAGRLPFHSAPRADCRLNGVFVIPKDALIVYAQTPNGWSSVMYVNPRTGGDASGWVRSSRLRTTGAIAPAR